MDKNKALDSKAVPLSETDIVVVIDDEMFSRFVMLEILRGLGNPQVIIAKDGGEAEEILRGEAGKSARLVILDFHMPKRNGLEILKELRSGRLGAPRGTPVVMITGMDDTALAATAISLDVDAFLVKPVMSGPLAEQIRQIFASTHEIADTAKYEAVDIAPAVDACAFSDGQSEADAMRRVSVLELEAGMLVVRDITGPNNNVLVARGTTLTGRLVRLLHGLHAGGLPLSEILVERR
jgi:two-component system chemotaxis response regulator CheY